MEKANKKRGHAILELLALISIGLTLEYIVMLSYFFLVDKSITTIFVASFVWALFYVTNYRKFNRIADEIFSKD